MGELVFVGMGLYDERDLSLRAVETLRGAGAIFAEQYTSRQAPGSLERLSSMVGHPIVELGRPDVEGETKILEALATTPVVALLVVGEPFAATTHVSLRVAAERAGHTWNVIPNASILTAAASLVGLSHYKFGRTVSIPVPREGFNPTSPFEAIAANKRASLHTLVLLDLDPTAGLYLTADVALGLLAGLESKLHLGVARDESLMAVVARAGSPTAQAWVGPLQRLKRIDFGPPLHCLIVPSDPLNVVEDEALNRWRVRKGT